MAPLGCTELIQRSDFKSYLEGRQILVSGSQSSTTLFRTKNLTEIQRKKITLCSLKSSPSKTKEHGINKVCRSNEGENIMSEMPVCQQNLCSIITAAGCWEMGTDGTLKVL